MKTRRLPLFLAIFAGSIACVGQTSNVRVTGNCSQIVNLSANGAVVLDNRGLGCDSWLVVYEIYGGTPAGTVAFQGAASSASGDAPGGGSYAAFGTVAGGSNPSTAAVGVIQVNGYEPWVRVNLTGLSGHLRGFIFGWLSNPGGGGSGGSGLGGACQLQGAIAITGSGNTRIAAGASSLRVAICHISFQSASPVNWKLTQGTGTNCGTGTSDVSGVYQNSNGAAFDRDLNPIYGAAGNDMCLNFAAAVNAGGLILFARVP